MKQSRKQRQAAGQKSSYTVNHHQPVGIVQKKPLSDPNDLRYMAQSLMQGIGSYRTNHYRENDTRDRKKFISALIGRPAAIIGIVGLWTGGIGAAVLAAPLLVVGAVFIIAREAMKQEEKVKKLQFKNDLDTIEKAKNVINSAVKVYDHNKVEPENQYMPKPHLSATQMDAAINFSDIVHRSEDVFDMLDQRLHSEKDRNILAAGRTNMDNIKRVKNIF